ncbi:hypothetical protein [Streptomyces sp. NPDC058613]|uniref:hypothetical protein n=1 Tax=Streptomyces sp. NPDC058613 TaxID=3346556 RepID=UPI00364F62F3
MREAVTAVGRLVDATLRSLTAALRPGRARVPGEGVPGGGPFPLHHHARRRGPRSAGPDGGRRPRLSAAGRTGQERGAYAVTAKAPAPGRRGLRVWTERVRVAWWTLSDRDRIAVEGLVLSGLLFAAAWRAGHLGMAQADFVLSVLAGTAGVATLYRGAVHRPRPAPPPAGPLVAPSEEVQRHAAREAGTAPGA